MTPVRIAGVILAIAAGIWAGRWFYTWNHHEQGVRSAAGESSAPFPTDLADVLAAPLHRVKIPERIPDFSLDDRNGRKTPISAFAGKSLVINFWATWCAPCRSEMPLLKSLSTEWAGREVTVVGIAVDHRDAVLSFASKLGIEYPILIGDQDALDAASAFGVTSPVFPFTVFTDRRGEVVTLFVGEIHRDQAELILSKVNELDRDAVKLPEARKAIAEALKSLDSRRG